MNKLEIIEKVLKDNNISPYWYSINKPKEDTMCIMQEDDGIHIFVAQRGVRSNETIHTNVEEALEAISQFLPREE